MLSTEHRAEIKQIIEDEIANLEESVRSLQERVETVSPDVAIGRLSRMDSLVNKGTVEIALAESMKKLRRLHDKLSRINDPEFGRCGMCHEWIPIERLRTAPDRGVCVPCMKKR